MAGNPMCKGHKKDGSPCGNRARDGGTVCNSHGGRARQVVAKAQARQLEGALRIALGRLGTASKIIDPLTELQRQAGRMREWMVFLEEQVEESGRLRFGSQWSTEQIDGRVELLTRAQKEFRETLTAIGRLKIDERLAAIEEATATMIFRAVQAGLNAAGVRGPAATEALKVVSKELRMAKAGAGDPNNKATGF